MHRDTLVHSILNTIVSLSFSHLDMQSVIVTVVVATIHETHQVIIHQSSCHSWITSYQLDFGILFSTVKTYGFAYFKALISVWNHINYRVVSKIWQEFGRSKGQINYPRNRGRRLSRHTLPRPQRRWNFSWSNWIRRWWYTCRGTRIGLLVEPERKFSIKNYAEFSRGATSLKKEPPQKK